MATAYKATIVSDFISYTPQQLELIIAEAVRKVEQLKGNTIRIKIIQEDGKNN